ncbi:MAG: AAA family ATPase [candidate division KSB1 bacterium]|nr:AAA family ATPase [candidate division KSB1 bacterium]
MPEVDLQYLDGLLTSFASEPDEDKKRAILSAMQECRHLHVHLALEGRLLEKYLEVTSVQREVQELRKTVEALTAPPHHQAILFGKVGTNGDGNGTLERAIVATSSGHRIEAVLSPQVKGEELRVGDLVVLDKEAACILADHGPYLGPGEVGQLLRVLPDGRLLLQGHGDEQIVAEPAAALRSNGSLSLKEGARVLYERASGIAFEVIPQQEKAFLSQTKPITFAEVGGLHEQIERIKEAVFWPILYPEKFAEYSLDVPRGILLSGPPGCGKTLLARATIFELLRAYQERDGAKEVQADSHFLYVKGPELLSMWVGETERAIREVFRRARDTSAASGLPVLIFWDEIESLIPVRGSRISSSVDATIVPTFLSEIEGLENANGKVVLMAATNRIDAVDPGMLRPGRFDYILDVPRPNKTAAKEILRLYLRPSLPLAPRDGKNSEDIASELIDTVAAYVYCETEDNRVATILFRDGSRQPVRRSDLFSGAVARDIVQKAARRAMRRELQGSQVSFATRRHKGVIEEPPLRGILAEDLIAALDEEMASLARALTPKSIRSHVSLQLQDQEVVAIEPHTPRPRTLAAMGA